MGLFVLTTFILISTAQVCLTKKKQKKNRVDVVQCTYRVFKVI